MSIPPMVQYVADTLNGVNGYTTAEGLFISAARLVHLSRHEYDQDRPEHGVWEIDNDEKPVYGNLMMKILSCAERAWKRAKNNSGRVRSDTVQNGRRVMDVQVSSTDSVGRAVTVKILGNGMKQTSMAWVNTVRLVLDPQATTAAGTQVRPVVTCFPVR
jgi:hypothetical protein